MWYARILHGFKVIIWLVFNVEVALHVHYLHMLYILVFWHVLEKCTYLSLKGESKREVGNLEFQVASGDRRRSAADTSVASVSGNLCMEWRHTRWPLGSAQPPLKSQKLRINAWRPQAKVWRSATKEWRADLPYFSLQDLLYSATLFLIWEGRISPYKYTLKLH